MNYLMYKEHSAENLQFYLWHQDYVERFHKAPASDLALAPEWTKAKEDEVSAMIKKEAHERVRNAPPVAAGIFKGTDFEMKPAESVTFDTPNPFATPPRTATSS